MTTDPRERLLDLLSAEATQGLTEDEIRELRGLLLVFQDEDPDSLAYSAAAADRALDRAPTPPLPPALAQAVERQGRAFFANAPEPYRPPPRPRTPRSTYVAWALVAGLAAVLLWTLRPTREPTLDQLSAALRKLPDSQVFIGENANISGDLVWNPAKQQGYVKVTGLPVNDPTKEQYQLWIVDGGRSTAPHAQPVDGGVFDVQPDGTALIPVKTALKIRDAKAFAITKEVAGGVVESKGEHVLVLKPKAG